MKKFQNFYDYRVLEESLNTPVEFYLTDDTQLPIRIYGAFQLDDDTYGMSLEQSDHKGIYILNMYRVLAKKPRKWSFKKPSHIRPGLSTLIKFMEACVPFVKAQMKGIMIVVSGQDTERYVKFAERVIKRSYITSFKVLPTVKSADAKKYQWETIFVSRIGISPKTVFSDSKFKKYDFSDGILGDEIAPEIKPIRRERLTVNTTPSKKYTFGQLEIENITIDSEIFDLITKVEKDVSKSIISTETKKTDTSNKFGKNLTKNNLDFIDYFKNDAQKNKIGKFFDIANANPEMIIAALVNTYIRNNPSIKINSIEDMRNLIDEININNSTKYTIFYLIESSVSYELVIKDAYELVKKGLPKKVAAENIVHIVNQYEKTVPKKLSYKPNPSISSKEPSNAIDLLKTNIEPSQLISGIPGQGNFRYTENFYEMYNGNTVEGVDVLNTIKFIQEDLGYYKEVAEHKNIQQILDYTSSDYKMYNNVMRSVFKDFLSGKSGDDYSLEHYRKKFETGYVHKLASVFDDITPMKESLWVYRETTLPDDVAKLVESGEDFVDPAFLSTSIRHDLNWTNGPEDHKFRIFIPKGARVIPALDNSEHKSEREVVLPPFSILKIIRIDKSANYYTKGRMFITCIYVGSAYNSFREKYINMPKTVKENTRKFIESTSKKKDDYDPKDKYAVKTDASMIKATQDFIKKLKIKK
jgi:hypothetical protein